MPCDTVAAPTREQIIQNAIAALRAGRASIKTRAGRASLEGLTAQERGPMGDACILAGIARRADILTRAKIAAAGTTPEKLIQAHGHHH